MPYFVLGFILVIFVCNNTVLAQTAATTLVTTHSNEFIFLVCVACLVLSCWLSYKLPDMGQEVELPKDVKVIAAVLGGILAFTYSLHKDKELTLANPIWISVAAIGLPVTLKILLSKMIDYAKRIDEFFNNKKGG